MFARLRDGERLAEADEVLSILIDYAWAEGDRAALGAWHRERRWIRESWDEPDPATIRLGGQAEPSQLELVGSK